MGLPERDWYRDHFPRHLSPTGSRYRSAYMGRISASQETPRPKQMQEAAPPAPPPENNPPPVQMPESNPPGRSGGLIRVGIAVLLVACAALGAAVGVLALQLGDSKTEIAQQRALNGELAQAKEELTASLTKAQARYTEAESELAESKARNDTLDGLLADAKEDIDGLKGDLAQVQNGLAATKADLDATRAEATAARTEAGKTKATVAVLQEDLAVLESEKATLASDLQAAVEEGDTAKADLEEVTDRYEAFRRSVDLEAVRQERESLEGEISHLRGTAQNLQDEITRLEEARQPLLLSPTTSRRGFRCTGSMNPVITCMDEATWLDDYRPQDVVIGAVITFSPPPDCDLEGPGNVAHRVMDIRAEDGVYYYWPKGDNNLEADGCWVPHSMVSGYIVEIHRGVRPENATLHYYVQTAREAWLSARDAYYTALAAADAAEMESDNAYAAYEEAIAAYRAYAAEYGCSPGETCTFPSGAPYEQAVSLLAQADAAYDLYSAAFDRYEEAFDHATVLLGRIAPARATYDCWHDVALEANVGEIPRRC